MQHSQLVRSGARRGAEELQRFMLYMEQAYPEAVSPGYSHVRWRHLVPKKLR